MILSVFGLGYVGCTTAACFAQAGVRVIGVDVSAEKVKIINNGASPVSEPALSSLIKKAVATNALQATVDDAYAISRCDISFVCVGTPSKKNGGLDLTHLEDVLRSIGRNLKTKDAYHVIVIRSTVFPRYIAERLIPIVEKESGKKTSEDFGICVNPEFLREGSAIEDFYDPPRVLIGAGDARSAQAVKQLYKKVDFKNSVPVIVTSIDVAGMVKYVDNAFHALKVTFANETGKLCKSQGIDSRKVMEIFRGDHKLNISEKYLASGFAFGGSCLPKDVKEMVYEAKQLGLLLPVIANIIKSNQTQIDDVLDFLETTGKKHIGIVGLTFKEKTDDFRNSPYVDLAGKLLEKGFQVTVYDPDVKIEAIIGANKEYLAQHLPCYEELFVESAGGLIEVSETVIVSKDCLTTKDFEARTIDGKLFVDFVNIKQPVKNLLQEHAHYYGLYW